VYAGRYHAPFRLGDVTIEVRGTELWATLGDTGAQTQLNYGFGDTFGAMIGGVNKAVHFIRSGGGPADLLSTDMGVATRQP
jgi:hypothetical protein